jgi:transposase
LIYLLRTGGAWRSLPACFPNWKSVYTRWRRWIAAGLWDTLWKAFCCHAQTCARFLDATYIKVHQDAHGARRALGPQAMGRTKGGITTKLHALVDGTGRAVALRLTDGPCADVTMAPALTESLSYGIICADKAYDSAALRTTLERLQNLCVIPGRSNRLNPVVYDEAFYKLRHLVENYFQRLKRFRRLSQRVEKLSLTYFNFVLLATILDWIAREV